MVRWVLVLVGLGLWACSPAPPRPNVLVEDFFFSPALVEVGVGEQVEWRNDGRVGHTVAGLGDGDREVGVGKTYSFTFTEPGTYSYYCIPHPWMKGVVVVKGGGR